MLAAVVTVGELGRPGQAASGWGGEKSLVGPPVSPLEVDCTAVGELTTMSEQAAGLTGALALLEPGDRAQRAADAAVQVRTLERRAARLPGGAELARTLGDLARALERYSAGDAAAMGALRAASTRNAILREKLERYCGGEE
jgi:hypothetical protein